MTDVVFGFDVEDPVNPNARQLPECVDQPPIEDRRFGSSNRRPGLSTDPLWDIWRSQSWSYRPAVSGA